MTKKAEVVQDSVQSADTLGECPSCKATIWQGPFMRGPIRNGEFAANETLFQCMNCHAVMPIEQMNSRAVGV